MEREENKIICEKETFQSTVKLDSASFLWKKKWLQIITLPRILVKMVA